MADTEVAERPGVEGRRAMLRTVRKDAPDVPTFPGDAVCGDGQREPGAGCVGVDAPAE